MPQALRTVLSCDVTFGTHALLVSLNVVPSLAIDHAAGSYSLPSPLLQHSALLVADDPAGVLSAELPASVAYPVAADASDEWDGTCNRVLSNMLLPRTIKEDVEGEAAPLSGKEVSMPISQRSITPARTASAQPPTCAARPASGDVVQVSETGTNVWLV
jgi:hypothetical protein